MPTTPIASVCVPIRNGQAFLGEAIRSVLRQDFDDFELILVDDASDDESPRISTSFADPRIRFVQQRRQLGIPGNWNYALALARGTYVCVFHQDDLMYPENLGLKVRFLEDHSSVQWVHSAVEPRVESAPHEFSTGWMEQSDSDFVAQGSHYFRKLLFNGNIVCAPTVVARRDAFLMAGGFNSQLPFACDYEMWLRLCLCGDVGYLAVPSVVYRWHANNATHEFFSERGLLDVEHAASMALTRFEQCTDNATQAAILREGLRAVSTLRSVATKLVSERDALLTQIQHQRQRLRASEELFRLLTQKGSETTRWNAHLAGRT